MPKLSKAEQARIMREDAKRRAERELQDYLVLKGHAGTNSQLTRGDGMPLDYVSNKLRNVKATDDCWNRGLRSYRTVGVAPGSTTPTASVRVIRVSGYSEIVSARSFGRPSRRSTNQQVRVVQAPDCLTMAATVGYIGNVE